MHKHVVKCTKDHGCSMNLSLTDEEKVRLTAARRTRRVFAALDEAPESARRALANFYANKADTSQEYAVYKTQEFNDRYIGVKRHLFN